jgi:hypothetical protein
MLNTCGVKRLDAVASVRQGPRSFLCRLLPRGSQSLARKVLKTCQVRRGHIQSVSEQFMCSPCTEDQAPSGYSAGRVSCRVTAAVDSDGSSEIFVMRQAAKSSRCMILGQ